jgi:diguanylate cyclase (GGDEF)-like protein
MTETAGCGDAGGRVHAPLRRSRSLLPVLRLEVAFILLLAATLLAIEFQGPLLSRSLTFDATSGNYTPLVYDDSNRGGMSSAWIEPDRPLAWSCEVRATTEIAYCGMELLIDGARRQRGIDLTPYDTVTLDLAYSGPAKTLRLQFKNHDPRYSRPSIGDGDKFNRIGFMPRSLNDKMTFDLAEVIVPEWWLFANDVPADLARPDLGNVIAIDVQTGAGLPSGTHHFQLKSIRFNGQVLSTERFYLVMLGVWIAAICLVFIRHIVTLTRDVEARRLLHAEAERQAAEAERAARIDPLTRLLNRAGITEQFQALQDRESGLVTAMLIDIDHFKSINDTFGHPYGDEVLATFAAILRRNARPEDVVGRWGGEEFVILCTGLEGEQAMEYANALRSRVAHFHFGESERVTASFGLRTAPTAPLTELLRDADVALYAAKARGRNRVELFGAGLRDAA